MLQLHIWQHFHTLSYVANIGGGPGKRCWCCTYSPSVTVTTAGVAVTAAGLTTYFVYKGQTHI